MGVIREYMGCVELEVDMLAERSYGLSTNTGNTGLTLLPYIHIANSASRSRVTAISSSQNRGAVGRTGGGFEKFASRYTSGKYMPEQLPETLEV